ncbi:response regulator [Tychonema sp. LEGE 06208]|uniref:response regulator n=1 Tax=Tychonema sp. LEGE 06208 TaxID=1828663 RepID=UPI00187F9FFD|nr:response regulator [Tychonema sp. LEGE 06208]MBE9162082.1 response regulator [Tychonema sp. LEGE 06208]
MSKPVILCVDDERMVLDSLSTQLAAEFGDTYTYEGAEDAEEALEVIGELYDEETSVIVIISDWLMPGIKGDELLIRIHKQYPHIITIMLTGQADEVAVDRVKKQANLHRCLSKPWSEADLLETIKSGLLKL